MLRAVLTDGEQTWQTTVAYFASMEGADRTAAGAVDPEVIASAHRDEIDMVVASAIRERLVETLGAERAGQLESHVGSLATLVGSPPSSPTRP